MSLDYKQTMGAIGRSPRNSAPAPLRRHRGGKSRNRASAGVFERLLEVLFVWQDRIGQRQHLGQLDDRLLADMGLAWEDVHRECLKPFWRP